jgi:hypothetical protein
MINFIALTLGDKAILNEFLKTAEPFSPCRPLTGREKKDLSVPSVSLW